MKKMTKTSSDSQTGDAGTPEILAPFSTFSTLMTVYNGSDAAQQLRAPWVGAMPPIGLGDWAVVLSADPATQPQPPRDPGLYVNYAGKWVLAAPYDAMCDYSARGLEFDVYLDVKKAQAVPAGAVVYHNGNPEAKTAIPAGAGLYAAVTLDDVTRQRETSLAAADPTAKLGLTVVKGTSKSFMRADAAPPLDQTIAPTWSGSHTFSGASPTIANDQTVAAHEPGPKQLITRAYAEKNFKGGGVSGADPTAKLGLTAVKGTSTSFMRADAAPVLDQSIAPTWRATHAFNVPGKRMVKLVDKIGTAANTTRTDLSSLDTPYMGIGGSEWNKAYYLVGYGYNAESASYPVLVGAQEVTTSDNTTGAFIVATRNGGAATDKPTVKFKVTPDGRAEITNDQIASGYTPAANELITRAYVEAKFKSSGADPTAKLGLTAVKGTSTSFMRADAAPALDQSIAPTWRAVHSFNVPGKRMVKLADKTGASGDTTRTDLSSLDTPYMGIGGSEWNKAYYLVGYGYNEESASYPVLVGSQEVTTSDNTTGAFIVATRNGGAATDKPTVKFKVTPDGRAEITNDQTASGYTPVANELITRAYAEKNFKGGGGGANGADPTAKLGLTAVKGSSTSFMRADAAPALDQAIAPTWSGSHTFSGASPAIAKDQTAKGNEPAPNQLITRRYFEAKSRFQPVLASHAAGETYVINSIVDKAIYYLSTYQETGALIDIGRDNFAFEGATFQIVNCHNRPLPVTVKQDSEHMIIRYGGERLTQGMLSPGRCIWFTECGSGPNNSTELMAYGVW